MARRSTSGCALKVMVATPVGGLGQGGIDRVMGSLKRELERRPQSDFDVRFLSTRGKGHVALSYFHLSAFCLRMTLARLRGELDVVHINLASYGSTYRKLVIASCARALGIAYVLHLHGAEYMSFWSDRDTLLNRRIRRMFAGAQRIVVLGTPWRDFVAAKAPEAADRIVVIPNAAEIPPSERSSGGDEVHIVFLGRLEERKGVPQLCAALASLHDLPGWRATIAGDGAIEETRALAARLGLTERVDIPGWQPAEKVSRLLSQADILTLPSFAENLPISIIEGMAAGLGVVATPVGAVEDIITDGETGLLVPPGDVAALAAALKRLIEDPALRERLGTGARAVHRQRLDVVPFADALCAVWCDAAEKATGLEQSR